MFKTLINAFKIEDLRKKLIYTFLMLIVIRIGSQLPVPGVNRDYFAAWFAAQNSGAFNFFDAFSGVFLYRLLHPSAFLLTLELQSLKAEQ